MKDKVMIENCSTYPMKDVLEYMAGYTTKLNGKITVTTVDGNYYDNIMICNSKF
jgi:hypothetical protein